MVQDLRNVQILERLNENDENSYENIYICKKKGDPNKYVCKMVKDDRFNPLEFTLPLLMQSNPHFVKVHNFGYNRRGDVIIIMDYIKDGDLFNLIKKDYYKLNEFTCRNIILMLVNALQDLHKKKYIHNDVKLENLLFDRRKKRLYICDYGLARAIGTPSFHDGTTVYFSPEKIKKHPYEPSFDWWAVGVVAYEILSSNYPFNINEDSDTDSIEPCDMLPLYSEKLECIKNISRKAMDFVTKMLTPDINNRLNNYDQIIKHPFLEI